MWIKRSCNAKNIWVQPAIQMLPWDIPVIRDVQKIMPKTIWKDIWIAWSKYNYYEPKNKYEILEQIMWYNSQIRCANKVLRHDWLNNSDIQTIRDIANEEGTAFFTFEQFEEKYGNCTNFIQYYTVIAAIPAKWKQFLFGNNARECNSNDYVQKWEAIQTVTKVSIARLLWSNELKVETPPPGWSKLLREINKLTLSTKLRYFQYRLLNRSA